MHSECRVGEGLMARIDEQNEPRIQLDYQMAQLSNQLPYGLGFQRRYVGKVTLMW